MARHFYTDEGDIISTDFGGICIQPASKLLNLPARELKSKLKRFIGVLAHLKDLNEIDYILECGCTIESFFQNPDDHEREYISDLLKAVERVKSNPLTTDDDIACANKILAIYLDVENRKALRRTANKTLRRRVLARDRSTCRYCGINVSDDFHIDHVYPYSRGGKTVEENLVVSCRKCNFRKRGKTLEESGMKLLELS